MSLLTSLLKDIFITPDVVGRQGERLTAAKLGWVDFFGKKGKILQNVYVPKEDGDTTEIDLIYITQKGLLIIESKNYSGYIFGDERNRNWTSTLYAGKDWIGRKRVEKHHFYNPIWQNNGHVKAIKRLLGSDIEIISIVVFSDRCELKSVSVSSQKVYVCKRGALPQIIREIWREHPDTLSEKDIETIYGRLMPLTGQDREVRERHIERIESKLNNEELCPYCGGNLVLRTARRGPNEGGQFWGCKNYPSCKYTRNFGQNK
jgi:hypothetical protein